MITVVFVLGLVGAVFCQQPVDDGSYDAERYEIPYLGETSDTSRGYAPISNSLSAAPAPRAYQPAATYQNDPRNAAILSEARYLSADGKFGASYTQEDGVQFKEEADPDGTRRGTYSYVDPTGARKTVSYVAGKFGFQASGDHLPAAPAAAQPQVQAAQPQYRAPQPQYQPDPQPQYQPAPQPQYQAAPQSIYQPAPQPQYQAAPQPQYQAAPQPQYQPAPQPQYQAAPQPQYRSQYRAEPAPVVEGPSHPTITQSTSDSYSISAAF